MYLIMRRITEKFDILLDVINESLKSAEFDLLCFPAESGNKESSNISLKFINYGKNEDFIEYTFEIAWLIKSFSFDVFILDLTTKLKNLGYKEVKCDGKKIIVVERSKDEA